MITSFFQTIKKNTQTRPALFAIIFLGAIVLLVFINLFTPLRLNTDGIRYLNIVEYLKGNFGNNSVAAHDYLPHGYPWLLFLLDKVLLLCPAVITLINIISVLLSSYLLSRLLGIKDRLVYLGLVLLSFVCIKHYTLVVADEVFTLIFIAAIYCWSEFFGGKRAYIIPAIIISMLSIVFRNAGIAIIAGVILYIIYLYRNRLFKSKVVVFGLIAVFIAAGIAFMLNIGFFEKHIDYVRQLDLEGVVNRPASVFQRVGYHLQEMGEICINTPFSKLSPVCGDGVLWLFIATGLVAFVVLFYTIFKLKVYHKFLFWVFICYLVMILLWPFYDTRFLIPVIPFFICFFMRWLISCKRKYLSVVCGGIYLVFGLFSIGYSDMLSVSRPFFLKHYGFDPSLTKNYSIHFNDEKNKPPHVVSYDISKDNELYLLNQYDKKPFHK